MLPSASMMKPLPAPRCGGSDRGLSGPSSGSGGSIIVRPRRRDRSRPRAVASMFTTAGLMRSTTSEKLTRPLRAGVACEMARPLAALTGAPADTAERATPPAKIAPTRNATTAVNTTVTMVKRLDIFALAAGPHPRRELTLTPRRGFAVRGAGWPQALLLGRPLGLPSHYKVAKLVFGQDVDAELLGLLQLAPGLGASDEVVGFFTHRPRDLRAEALQ